MLKLEIRKILFSIYMLYSCMSYFKFTLFLSEIICGVQGCYLKTDRHISRNPGFVLSVNERFPDEFKVMSTK